MNKEIYEKMNFKNTDITYSFHRPIVEFDIHQASLSISDRYGLLDKDFVNKLKLLPKEDRVVQIGCIQRDDKEFSKKFLQYELDIRKQFIEENKIPLSDIITCHSDSLIFIYDGNVKDIKSDIDGIPFTHRNTWTSYMLYKEKIEMYFDNNKMIIDYKGIPKDMVKQHMFGIHKYLMKVFHMLEERDSEIYRYLSMFQRKYLMNQLPDYYYFPFGYNGKYKLENMNLFGYIADVALLSMKGGYYNGQQR